MTHPQTDMTNNNHGPTNPHDRDDEDPHWNEDHDKFHKEVNKRVGQRGDELVERERKSTEIGGKKQEVDVILTSYCICGAPLLNLEDTYRCTGCDRLCCNICKILHTKRILCPDCAKEQYSMTRDVYLTLLLLEEDVRSVTDLFTTQTTPDGQITVTIGTTVATLLDRGYLRTTNAGGQGQNTLTITADNPISATGKEALHIGEQLYQDDPDIEEMKDQIKILKVANNAG